jgi:hypothetical protein
MKTLLTLLIALAPFYCFSQTSKQDSIWMPMKKFTGVGTGTGDGEPGKGKYERSYHFILNKKFIEIKNKSTYPPTTKNTKGEIHEDIGYISYDKVRKLFVLRQFHVEGFVNQFYLESISSDGKTIVFISESIENISAGWRAREMYQFINDDEFEEIFELATPNAPFEIYTKATLKRIKQ